MDCKPADKGVLGNSRTRQFENDSGIYQELMDNDSKEVLHRQYVNKFVTDEAEAKKEKPALTTPPRKTVPPGRATQQPVTPPGTAPGQTPGKKNPFEPPPKPPDDMPKGPPWPK